MYKFGKAVVKLRLPILILALALIIPAWLGMQATRINYDMLTYLPEDIETMKGQDILMDEFGKGAFSFIVAEGMEDKDVSDLRQRIEQVPHVDSALWYDSIADLSIPKELLPDKLRDVFVDGDATMIAVFFDTSSSADETIEAITEIRQLCGKQCFVSGISALVTDLKNLCEREEPIYVGIAVLCALVAMELLTDSWLVPLVFLAGIGITILGTLLGLAAGFLGKYVDAFVMRLADVVLAFPSLLLAMVVMYTLGSSILNMFIALSIINWAGTARVVRAQTLALKEKEFVEAARSMGVSRWKIAFRHILPNCLPNLIVLFTLDIPGAIMWESSMSFLGVGDPNAASWGLMVSQGKGYAYMCPWLILAPGIAILVTVMAFNFIGDGLRDAIDPYMKT